MSSDASNELQILVNDCNPEGWSNFRVIVLQVPPPLNRIRAANYANEVAFDGGVNPLEMISLGGLPGPG